MCLVAFLGTDAVLDTAPADGAAFFIGEPSPSEQAVRAQFSTPNVYYLGTHTHCGCGYGYGQDPAEYAWAAESPEEVDLDPLEPDARRQLAQRLRQLVDAGHRVEVHVCWSGDEAAAPARRLRLTPEAFLDPNRIAEGDAIRVIPSSPGPS